MIKTAKTEGISLIVLVITIIVMIIIATAIILSISNTNVIAKAKDARAKNEVSLVKEKWQRAYSEALIYTDGIAPKEEQILARFGEPPADYLVKETGMQYTGKDTAIIEAANILGVEVVELITTYTTTKGSNKYNVPYIPTGFYYVGGTWDTGLVISDSLSDFNVGENATLSGNQFVWVPVDGINVTFVRWSIYGASSSTARDDTFPTGVSNDDTQVTNYGGFYIGRYEAGKVSTDTLVSKKLSTVWINITYIDSRIKAADMYNNSEIKSGLVTGKQWDTTMRWIQNSGKSVTDSKAWGNYANSADPANVTGYGSLKRTGYSEYWKVNNIYDLAGNVSEWTNEINGSYNAIRGGQYFGTGSNQPAGFRAGNYNNYSSNILTFRVVLYIL